ncbi:MAG: PAS domain S-box protein, partial [Desulfobacterales bacterium]|nr:PAS domain S-box protein [Desulfobacterales bacterium]
MYPLKIGAAGTPWSVKINVSKDLVLAQAVNIQSNMEISLKEIHEKLKKKNNRGLTMQLLFGVVLTIVIVFIIYVLAKKELRKRRRAEKELLKARNYISNIIDSMPSVLVGVDAEGKVTQWNSEARRATGVPAERAVGRPLDQAFPRLAADMARVREAIASRAEQSDSKRAWKEDGETRYEDVSVYPLIANGVEGAVIRVDDVTERVRLEEMMVQSEKMLSVGGLAAGMAHEINNPLAGMMQTANVMAGRLLTENMPANERAAVDVGATMAVIRGYMEARGIPGMIKTINESGRRVAAIVDNMLSFARKS